ncbi:hypothetical protein ACQJBY_058581 [Aegilops geniculata]
MPSRLPSPTPTTPPPRRRFKPFGFTASSPPSSSRDARAGTWSPAARTTHSTASRRAPCSLEDPRTRTSAAGVPLAAGERHSYGTCGGGTGR